MEFKFEHDRNTFVLFNEGDNVEIYNPRTDFSGFAKFPAIGCRVEVEVPMGPTFIVSRGFRDNGISVSVKTEKLLVLNQQ